MTSERPVDKEKEIYMGIRGWDAIARRQEVFKKYGFGVPPGHEVSLTRNSEAKSGYARCAETFVYLWLQQQEYFEKRTGEVRGFALNPKHHGAKIASMEAYDVNKLSKGLTDSCLDTCQALMIPHFNEEEGQRCLFMLGSMDQLSNGKNMHSKSPKEVNEGRSVYSKPEDSALEINRKYL